MNTVLLCILSIAIIVPYASSRSAHCTYHMYNAGDSLGTVACSDGANGIITNFGYSNISPMFPYVTAYSGASWNSPQCGKCVRVQGLKTAYLTVIDYCGPPPGGFDAHFDIAPPAFREIFGDEGVNAGSRPAEWDFVESWRCQGNKGNSGGNPPPSNPPPSNPPPSNGGRSTQRCGANWGAADSSCGRDCNNNNDCGGQLCFKDLKPCGGSNPPSNPPPSNPPPPPPSNKQKVTTRCGRDWSDANSKCGTPCSNDAVCGGEHCYADLNACTFGAAGEESADNFVIEESFNNDNTDNFAVDAAIADVAEEEYVDNYVDMAMVDANFGADSNFDADAAVAGELSSLNTQQQQQQTQGEAGMQGWMVGILVMFSITTVLLLAVIVLGVFVMRKH